MVSVKFYISDCPTRLILGGRLFDNLNLDPVHAVVRVRYHYDFPGGAGPLIADSVTYFEIISHWTMKCAVFHV